MASQLNFFLILQLLLQSFADASKYAALVAQETAYSPGYAQRPSSAAPRPTSPPQVLRQYLKRDQATCGYFQDNGQANVCGESQYCTTSASDGGQYGVWNCCNPTDCFLSSTCIDLSECADYCITSYMSAAGTWYSRFMCGGTAAGQTTVLVYSYEDTFQYTESLEAAAAAASSSEAAAAAASQSQAEAAAAASQSQAEAQSAAAQSQAEAQASEAAQSAADASSRSIESAAAEASAEASAESAAQAASESAARASSEQAALASSLSAEKASLSKAAKPFSTEVTVTQLITNSQGQTETRLTVVPTEAQATTSSTPKDNGLSKGATAGIAVAAVVGALLLAAGAFILYRIWKKKQEDTDDHDVPYITGTQVAENKVPPAFYPPPSQSGTLTPSNYQGSQMGSWR